MSDSDLIGFVTRKKALERGGKGSNDGSQRESIAGDEEE
jgi:hypothetical protein